MRGGDMKKRRRRPGRRAGGPHDVRSPLLRVAKRLPAEELTIRKLAEEANISPTMVVYVFGSLAGVLAAVAECAFGHLNDRLRAALEGVAHRDQLEQATCAYLQFGLEEEETWKKIHDPRLWEAVQDYLRSVRVKATKRDRFKAGAVQHLPDSATALFRRVEEQRGKALEVLTEAAHKSGCRPAGDAAHAASSLVDGMLWQVHFERVASHMNEAQRVSYLRRLIRGSIEGWRKPKSIG